MKKRILAILLALISVVSLMPMSAFAEVWNRSGADGTGMGISGKDWMSQLPNNAPLGQVNLPGSGDSLSPLSQNRTVAEQLEMGVRLLSTDVKIGSDTSRWENWQLQDASGFPLEYQVGDLFETVDKFLDDNPSETVVILFTPDASNSDALNRRMLDDLKGIAAPNERDWWRFTYFEQNDTIPTIGEMRSRCIILNIRDDTATPFRVSGYNNIFSYQAYDIRWFIHMALEAQYNHIPQDYSRTADKFCNELDTSHRISSTDYPFEYLGEPNIKLIALNCTSSGIMNVLTESQAMDTIHPELNKVSIYRGQRLGWVLIPFINEDICEIIRTNNLFTDSTGNLQDPLSPYREWPESVPQPTGNWDTENWMSRLPDDVQISQLNLPGTHDTGCLYVDWGFEDTAKTQDMDVAQQLDAGIRVLDIRCGDLTDYFTETWEWWKLGLCHGFVDCYTGSWHTECLALEDVMEDIEDFLAAHPTETVIMETAQEGWLDSTLEEATEALQYMAGALRHDRTESPDYNPDNDKWSSFLYYKYGETVPLLKDCRGKCIVISSPRVNGVDGRSYTNYEKEYDQDYMQRQDCLQFVMQDYFNPNLQDYTKRTDCFIEQGERNVLNPGNPDVMLYGYNANTMERAMDLDLFGAHGPKYHFDNMKATLESFRPGVGRRIGWIGMDFPTSTMIQSIIKSNKTEDSTLVLRLQASISSIEFIKHVQIQCGNDIIRDIPDVQWNYVGDGTYIANLQTHFLKETLDEGLVKGNIRMLFPDCAFGWLDQTLSYNGVKDGTVHEYELSTAVDEDAVVRLCLTVPFSPKQLRHLRVEYGDSACVDTNTIWSRKSGVDNTYYSAYRIDIKKAVIEQVIADGGNLHLSFPDTVFRDVTCTITDKGDNTTLIPGLNLREYELAATIPGAVSYQVAPECAGMGSVDPAEETLHDAESVLNHFNGSTAEAGNGARFVKWIDSYGETVCDTAKFVPEDLTGSALYMAVFEEYPITYELNFPQELAYQYDIAKVGYGSFTVAADGFCLNGLGRLREYAAKPDEKGRLKYRMIDGLNESTFQAYDPVKKELVDICFCGWNTEPDGSGELYSVGDFPTITGPTTFYAIWSMNPEDAFKAGQLKAPHAPDVGAVTLTPAPAEREGDGRYTGGNNAPQTGDESFTGLYIVMMLVSSVWIAVCVTKEKRRKEI